MCTALRARPQLPGLPYSLGGSRKTGPSPRVAVETGSRPVCSGDERDAASPRRRIEPGCTCREPGLLGDAAEQLVIHVANEVAVLFGQGVEGTVGQGDQTVGHAGLVAVLGEQLGQTLTERSWLATMVNVRSSG